MRISVISTMSDSPWGGSEELWAAAARAALERGDDVQINIYKWSSIPEKVRELERAGAVLNLHTRINFPSIENYLRKLLYRVLKRRPRSVRRISRWKPDLMVLSLGTFFDLLSTPYLIDFLLDTGIRYVLIFHHNYENGVKLSESQRALYIKVIEKAEQKYFVSEGNKFTAERMLGVSIKKWKLVKNPNNLKNQVLQPWPPDDSMKLACVARLDSYFKGQDILLQVFSSERWRNRTWELCFFGTGKDEEYLKRLVSFYGLDDKIKFGGHNNKIEEIWKEYQVLVLPSLSEGLPLAMVEAMISGRPVVATNVGDCGKFVIDGETGFLANGPDVNSLSEALEKCWRSKLTLQSMGEKAHRKAIAYQEENVGNNLLKEITYG